MKGGRGQYGAGFHSPAVSRDIVVIGASAGGVEALQAVVQGLPCDIRASVFVVLHLARRGPCALAAILDRAGPLAAIPAEDGMQPSDGHIYVAPPDHHLVFDAADRLRLNQDLAVNGHRPSVDALFRSAAMAYGSRVIGVVLSGSGDDGSAGLVAVARAGGLAIIQDPDDALHGSMPRRACEFVPDALVRPAGEIGPLIAHLVTAEIVQPAVLVPGQDPPLDIVGADAALDGALWLALRALEEKSALNRRLARSRRSTGDEDVASRFDELADECVRAIAVLRERL